MEPHLLAGNLKKSFLLIIIYFKLLKLHDISVVSPLTNLSPLILLVLSTTILGEVLTWLQILGIFVIIGFTYYFETIIHSQDRKDKDHKFHFRDLFEKDFKFHMSVFFMLLAFSLAAVSDRLIFEQIGQGTVPVITNLFISGTIVFIPLLIYYIFKGEGKEVFKFSFKFPKTMLVGFFTILSNFLILLAISLPNALVSLIVPLRRMSTLFSAVIGGMIFHDDHLGKKSIAVLGMFIGALLITI